MVTKSTEDDTLAICKTFTDYGNEEDYCRMVGKILSEVPVCNAFYLLDNGWKG